MIGDKLAISDVSSVGTSVINGGSDGSPAILVGDSVGFTEGSFVIDVVVENSATDVGIPV